MMSQRPPYQHSLAKLVDCLTCTLEQQAGLILQSLVDACRQMSALYSYNAMQCLQGSHTP